MNAKSFLTLTLLAGVSVAPGLRAQTSVTTTIGFLRSQLNPDTLVPTDTTTVYEVEGVVTTWVNLTTATSGLFYMQDGDAGIAVFHGGAANVVPPAGARVRVKAPVTHFNGLVELSPSASNPAHAVTVLSTNNPAPAPLLVSLSGLAGMAPADLDALEGRLVTVTNVTLVDTTTPTFRGGTTEKIVDVDGATFDLRIDARPDIGGQAKPTGPFAVIGVMGQFDTSNPWTSAYQVIPSRFADILTPSKAPTIRYTNQLSELVRPGEPAVNTLAEQSLRPGERLALEVVLSDPLGGPYQVALVDGGGLPAGAGWSPAAPAGSLTGTNRFVFGLQATAADAGKLFLPAVTAWNDKATNTTSWRVYVPTAEEQQVVLMEIFPNPRTNVTGRAYNPLRRDPPSENSTQHDEYLELVNFGPAPIDLLGWRVADAVGVRHVFYNPAPVAASGAFILYGGPLNGFPPGLDVPSEPASESSAGLALNNDGDTVAVYNAAGNLVFRVVYPGSLVTTDSSLTRYPDRNGAFVAQTNVADLAVSPGRQADGRLFSEPPPQPPQDIRVAASLGGDGAVVLAWEVQAGRTYSVWAGDSVTATFGKVATGLATGTYRDGETAAHGQRYFRISSP